MWSKKVAEKILRWGTGIFVIALFLLSHLAGDHDYISDKTAINIFYGLAGCMGLILLQFFIATDGKQKKELLIGMALSIAFLIIRRWLR